MEAQAHNFLAARLALLCEHKSFMAPLKCNPMSDALWARPIVKHVFDMVRYYNRVHEHSSHVGFERWYCQALEGANIHYVG